MKYPAAVLGIALAFLPSTLAWEPSATVSGVFDLAGPRSDGTLEVAGSGALWTMGQSGTLTRFAAGEDAGAEPYIAVSPGHHVASANCDFPKDETYVLRLHAPTGITRVSADGRQTSSLVSLSVPGLNGIAFDTVGTFDHRLLATATVNGKTELVAADCNGAVRVITKSAPVVEGGLAVAPTSFGLFGGTLIAPDELSGVIWSIGPDGTSHQVVESGLPKGGDIGVESVAFVPPGFSRGGSVYYADRSTPNNPHPGTDHVLRVSSSDLVAAGVKDGDLLAATEGGASMIDVRCETSCAVTTIVGTPTTAHGEGHIVFALNAANPTPTATAIAASPRPNPGTVNPAPFVALFAAVIAGLAAIFVAASRRRR
ncbi:MAG TPA: hypothetical protein VNA65_09155 [Candidatus Dormibacteraeota bacterium]|nr:hypothetical protein [Candidatus Dormibacteraeota bacterium]